MPCHRVPNESNPFIPGERMREKEKSAWTKKAPKTRFQVFPSTSESRILDVCLREGEPLQNITLFYPGLLEHSHVAQRVRRCRMLCKSLLQSHSRGPDDPVKICVHPLPSILSCSSAGEHAAHPLIQSEEPFKASFFPLFL